MDTPMQEDSCKGVSIMISGVIMDADRFSERNAFHEERLIRSCSQSPFDQCKAAVCDFNAGDPGRRYTAACIGIWGRRRSDHGMMGVAGNQQVMMLSGPVREPFFSPLFLSVVFGRTGRIGDSQLLQRTPQIADKET